MFTRLQAVEAELQAMKDLLAELTVNQDQYAGIVTSGGGEPSVCSRIENVGCSGGGADAPMRTLDSITTASSRKLIGGLWAKLDESIGSRVELRQYAAGWLGRAEQLASDRLKMAGRLVRVSLVLPEGGPQPSTAAAHPQPGCSFRRDYAQAVSYRPRPPRQKMET